MSSHEPSMCGDNQSLLTAGSVIRQLFLTKGDNNHVNDRALFSADQNYVRREDIVGVVKLFLPGVGWPAIAIQTMSGYLSEVLKR